MKSPLDPPRAPLSSGLARWKLRLPLAFVLVSLIALVAVPLLVDRRIDELRRSIDEVAVPARSEVTAIHVALAVGGSALNNYIATGDRRFLEEHARRVADADVAYARLSTLSQRMGAVVAEHEAALRELLVLWNRSAAVLISGTTTADARATQQALYEHLLLSAARLDEAITIESQRQASLIESSARFRRIVTLLLLLLAIASAGVVAWLGRRHLLAEQFRRRAREERDLRELASAFSGASSTGEVLSRLVESASLIPGAIGAYVVQERSDAKVEVAASAGSRVPEVGEPVPSRTTSPVSGAVPALDGALETQRGTSLGGGVPEPEVGARIERPYPGETRVRVPLHSDGGPLSVLVLVCAESPAPVPQEVRERISVMGDLASLALRRLISLDDAQTRRREVEVLMESKARLIRGFTHDVKNPLGGADGHLALLHEGVLGQLAPAQRTSVDRARASIRTALELIENLTELARAENKLIQIQRSSVDVAEVVLDVAEEHRGAAEARHLSMNVALEGERLLVETDAARLRQILGNLISNAIKYTPAGGRVEVRGTREDGHATLGDLPCVRVAVADTGPGIPEEKRQELFQEFSRLEPRAAPGAGLGLAISRRLARILGGDVTVESQVGKGSTFSVWLPASKPRER